MTEDMNPFPNQKLASDGTLKRKQEQRILDTLGDHPDGLGFNELLKEVEDIISRNTLKNRLEEYEDDEVVETPDDWRRGQKKKYSLTEKGKKPANIDEEFRDGWNYIWGIWDEVLSMYEEESFSREKVLEHVFNERVRFELATSVSADAMNDLYSPMIKIDSEKLPQPQEDTSIAEFYMTVAAELYKFYTQTVFGRIYIQTEGKSSRLKKEMMLSTYDSTIDLRIKMDEMWKHSKVPKVESDS